jgi:hypothetical protein
MTFLIICAFACSQWLSIISLLTTTLHVLSIPQLILYDSAIIYNMPVITRSQSRASLITPAELLQLSLTLINTSLLESSASSPTQEKITQNNTVCLASSLPNISSVTTSENLLCPKRKSTISQLPSSSLHFKNFPLSTDNFEISKCIECNTTESYYFGNSLCLAHRVFAHNFSTSVSIIMEEDCEDLSNKENTSSGIQVITKLLASLSTQITAQNAKPSNEIHQVVQTNDSFKQAVRSKLDELRALIWDMKKPASATTPSSCSVKQPTTPVPVPSLSQGLSHQVSFPSQSSSIMDQQSQMMSLFATSVSKLLMALS